MSIQTEKKHAFSEAESKLILAAHLIEDLQGQHNENIIQPILKNILNLQKNIVMVMLSFYFLFFFPASACNIIVRVVKDE